MGILIVRIATKLILIGFIALITGSCVEQNGNKSEVYTNEISNSQTAKIRSLNDFLNEEWNTGNHDHILLILANVLKADSVQLKWEELAFQRYMREEGTIPFILTKADSILLSNMGVRISLENRFWLFEYEEQKLISIHDMSMYSDYERIAKKQSDTLIYAYFDKFNRNEVAVFMH
jgi:hypothetical protein